MYAFFFKNKYFHMKYAIYTIKHNTCMYLSILCEIRDKNNIGVTRLRSSPHLAWGLC